MYFVLKYMDYEQYKSQELMDDEADSNTELENKTLLINPDCPIGIIRDYIAANLQFDDEDAANFDLCSDKAVVMNIQKRSPMECGLEVFINLETYYIIMPNNNGQQDSSKLLIPVLNRFSKEYLEFMAQQKRRSSSIKIKQRKLLSKSSNTIGISQSLQDGKISSQT